MAKDKKGSKAAAPAPKAAVSKPIESVKAGRVTKPVESTKAVAKEAAKKVAKGVKKGSKKVEKTLTPESSDDEDTSASSESSDDEKDVKVKAEPVSTSKAKSKNVSDSESDSDASSSSDSENDAAKVKNAPKVNGAGKVGSDADGSSSSGSDSSDGSDSEDDAPKVNGKAGSASSDDSDSDSGSDSDSSSSGSDDEVNAKAGAAKDAADDTSDASSSGSDSEEDEEPLPKIKVDESSKKRKAEDTFGQTPKKTKVMIEGEQKEATANLFIGNLSWNIDEEWLTREFEEFGEIKGVRVITDRDSGRSKGFGYVEFVEVDSAVQAVEAKLGSMLDGRNIRIDFSQPRQQKNDGFTPQQRSNDRAQRYGDTPKEPSKTLFVGNVSFDADESMLTELFQDYGTINAVRLPTDKMTEQLKGFGYVEFASIDEAKAAHDGLQGAEISNRPIRLDFASERSNDSPRGGGFSRGASRGRGGFGDRGGRGGFGDRGGRGGFGDRGRGRGAPRGGRGGTTNRGGFGDFSGKKTSF